MTDELIHRLPLPLAQLYRRAQNAKTPLERHLTAFSLWEAALKLLASAAIVEYAEQPVHDPALAERLTNLARPSLGHWWEFVRLLVPVLAERGDPGFTAVRDLVLGRTRDDLPRAAGLDACLREVLEDKPGPRTTVRFTELFDRLVTYRNKVMGHGAPGQLGEDFNERLGQALLPAAAEVLARLDVLAGRALLYVGEVRQASGLWLVQRYLLTGENATRIATLELPRSDTARLPDSERLYLEQPPAGSWKGSTLTPAWRCLHPLVLYDAEAEEVMFLNARRGRRRTVYLCYTSGRSPDRPDLGPEQRQLLARVLGMEVATEQADQWADRAEGQEAQDPTPEPPAPGRRTLGEFELLSELGRGGMGVVYRAWQPSLRRQVALKKLAQAGDARTETRFRREIRALGQVEHPHLVKVFTSGSDGDQWFYAMELVEGATLADVSARLQSQPASAVDWPTWQQAVSTVCEQTRRAEKPLSEPSTASPPPVSASVAAPRVAGRNYVRHVVELVRQAAEAAHALHERGVVHRDIKPGNLMVSADGSQAILMDLGLAQLADDVEGRLTRTRQFVGTLRYASPEQVLAVDTLDRRSDVYSLGATLWELLTLRPLYGADEHTTSPELMRRIQYDDPVRLRKYHPSISQDLEAIVQRCLEKRADRRYATARELADDLGRFLAGEPVLARPVGEMERLWRWCRRNRGVAALAAAVVLLLMVAAIGASIAAAWYVQVARQANADRLQAIRDQQFAEAKQAEAEREHEAAEAARRAQEVNLADSYTSLGLMADYKGDFAQSVLWFTRAAQLAGRDPEREQANRVRVRTWSRLIPQPIRALSHEGQPLTQLAFHPGGKHLLTLTASRQCFLWDLLQEQSLPWPPREGRFTCAAWIPDGQTLALGTPEGTVELWSFPSGQLLKRLNHKGSIHALAASPDGHFLAFAGDGVRIWDMRKQDFMGHGFDHPQPVLTLTFHPHKDRLATGCADNQVRVFALDNGPGETKPLYPPIPHLALVAGYGNIPLPPLFIDEGRGLLTRSSDAAVAWLNAETGQPVRKIDTANSGGLKPILSLAGSPDGKYFAVGGFRGARVWDVTQGRPLTDVLPHLNHVWSMAISPDSLTLLTVSEDHTGRLWSLPGGQPLGPPLAHQAPVLLAGYAPQGPILATAQEDGLLRLWLPPPGNPRDHQWPLDGGPTFARLSPDGRLAFATGPGWWWMTLRTTQVHDVATGEPKGHVLEGPGHLTDAALSPDGHTAVTLHTLAATPEERERFKPVLPEGKAGTLQFWNWQTGERLFDPVPMPSEPRSVAFSPTGHLVAVICGGGQVLLIDAVRGQVIRRLLHQNRQARWSENTWPFVRFTPDGLSLLTWGVDEAVCVWNIETGQLRYPPLRHGGDCYGLNISPDGLLLVTSARDKTVRVWDLATGKPVAEPLRHNDWVYTVSFSGDGQHILSACRDGMARLWDWRTGRLVCPPLKHQDVVNDAAFTPDGRWIWTTSRDSTARGWEWHTGKPVTPAYGVGGAGWSGLITPDGNHAVVAGGALTMFAFHLGDLDVQDDTAVEDLCLLAELQSGWRVHEGDVAGLTTEDWLERRRRYRERHQDFGNEGFSPPPANR